MLSCLKKKSHTFFSSYIIQEQSPGIHPPWDKGQHLIRLFDSTCSLARAFSELLAVQSIFTATTPSVWLWRKCFITLDSRADALTPTHVEGRVPRERHPIFQGVGHQFSGWLWSEQHSMGVKLLILRGGSQCPLEIPSSHNKQRKPVKN